MTTRPTLRLKQNRPNSAIYLGSDPLQFSSTPPGIPDLPEPPSPGASTSSNGSGLPSPPATNSTGSGSTGDPASIAFRKRPFSMDAKDHDMLNEANVKTFHTAFVRRNASVDDDDDDYDNENNDNDEDNTARLKRNSASENVLALQRVKSLTQRNRMALDKLSSYSRMSTPSPNLRSTRSPAPAATSHSQSASSSSSSSASTSSARLSNPQTRSRLAHRDSMPDHLSGSETERESLHPPSFATSSNSHSSNSHSSSSHSSLLAERPLTPQNRVRIASAPASPAKALRSLASASSNSSNNSNSPSRTRKRSSMAMTAHDRSMLASPDSFEDERDVTHLALAAVASSRRSPTVGAPGKRRQPLPKEFMNGAGGSASRRGSLDAPNSGRDSATGRFSAEPMTPHRATHSSQLSPRHSQTHSQSQAQSARPMTAGRSSTVRELTRKHQTRWLSEDMSSVSSHNQDDQSFEDEAADSRLGRRQSLRGGSAESALTIGANTGTAGRSLVGEGLRAAGLSRKVRDPGASPGVDVFESVETRRRTEYSLNDDTSAADNRERIRSWSRLDTRMADDGAESRTRAGTITGPRASTSMAGYRDNDGGNDEPRTAPPALRSHKSAYQLPHRDVERAGSALSRHHNNGSPAVVQHERFSSPFGSVRRIGGPSNGGVGNGNAGGVVATTQAQQQSEHTRLMMESLAMFESHLSRVPQLSSGAHAVGPDLIRTAQGIAHTAEKLNALLRHGTNKALEEQIDAEVDSAGAGEVDLVDVWRRVGGEYREGLRVSDELVRGITGLLLGVGRAVKDLGGGGEGHVRSMSLDEEGLSLSGRGTRGSMSPDTAPGLSGRRSAESRRSWEPGGATGREEAMRRLTAGRPESALAARPPSALNNLRERESDTRAEHIPPPKAAPRNNTPNGIAPSSMRRLYSPREQRELQQDSRQGGLSTLDSQETLHAYEPSPTPAPRQQRNQDLTERSRTLPPLAIPKPLPSLPSESQRRKQQTSIDKTPHRDLSRRKTTTSTVRGPFPSLTTPNPTTAVTAHTVSNTPDRVSFPMLLRTDSNKSNRSTVTFSRPTTISVSALNGLQKQDLADQRKRTISSTSSNNAEHGTSVPVSAPVTPLSGSETERDTRFRTAERPPRMSLDGAGGSGHPADRSAAVTSGRTRERRRTVIDVWPATGR